MMQVHVNGEAVPLPPGSTVADAVRSVAGERAERRMAVAHNGEVVPQRTWAEIVLTEGDRLEVVAAIQGGRR